MRTKEEFAGGHVVNAINIPLDDLESTTFDKTKTVLFIAKVVEEVHLLMKN